MTNEIKYSRGLCTKKEAAKTISPADYCDVCSTTDDNYEYIPDDRPVKLYFDIDLKGDADIYDGELNMTNRIVEIAKMGINEWAKNCMGDIEPLYCVSNSNSMRFIDWKDKKALWKVSLHIVVDNIIAMKSVQKDLVVKLNKFLLSFKESNDNFTFDIGQEIRGIWDCDNPKFFDESPYDKDRKLRAVGSSKPGENRPLVLVEGTFEQSVISGFIPEDAIEYVLDVVTAAPKNVVVADVPVKSEYDYKKVEDFINEGIFDERAKEHQHWINMGFALFNGFGEAGGWDLFDTFSKRYMAKYDEHNNREFWEKLAASIQPENKLTIKSVFKWARDDDKDAYTRITDKYKKRIQRENNKVTVKDEENDPDNYKNVFQRIAPIFEINHLKIVERGLYVKEFPDKILLFSPEKIKASYSHMQCGYSSSGSPIKFIDMWMNFNDNIRRYDDMNIYPDATKVPENHYNLWRPFAIDLFEGEFVPNEEARDIILFHIHILCNHEEEVYNYILLWIAHMLQFPAKKSVFPTLISLQGSGKGTLMKLFSRLIGASRVLETANPSRDVWGNFNGMMPEKFLVNLNELSRKETMESEGKIKALITDPTLTINPKGMNQYEINSYHRFFGTTNTEDPLKTSYDDRRNIIIRSSDEKKGDAEYFKMLNAYLEDDAVVRTIGAFFKSMDVKPNFNEYPMPRTRYQDDLKEASRPTHETWLAGFVENNTKEQMVCMYPGEVWTTYSTWCSQNGFLVDGMNSAKLGIRLNNLFKPQERSKYIETEKNGHHRKTFHITSLKKYFAEKH